MDTFWWFLLKGGLVLVISCPCLWSGLKGYVWWWQALTEPAYGSDASSLNTTAVKVRTDKVFATQHFCLEQSIAYSFEFYGGVNGSQSWVKSPPTFTIFGAKIYAWVRVKFGCRCTVLPLISFQILVFTSPYSNVLKFRNYEMVIIIVLEVGGRRMALKWAEALDRECYIRRHSCRICTQHRE